MNDFQYFEDTLIDNDFPIQDKPIFHIPKEVDAQTELELYRKARVDMEEANFNIVSSVAADKYELLKQLTDLYIHTSDTDRQRIREYLSVIKRWGKVFDCWTPMSTLMLNEPAQYLRLLLANLSMLDRNTDYRDTLVLLATTWHTMEELGFDPEPIYREALTWGGQLVEHVNDMLNPARRRACCSKCHSGKPHLEIG